MTWQIEFLEDAQNDLRKLDGSAKIQVLKGIRKVSQNPLPTNEGGYGKPLGSKSSSNLTGLLKIKFRDLGIRVVYKTEVINNIMRVIIISARSDDEVYKQAALRRNKNNL